MLWGALLGVGLFQFSLLAFHRGRSGGPQSIASEFVLPWAAGLVTYAPFVVAAIISACLLRPQRPGPFAAIAAGTALFCVASVRDFGAIFPDIKWALTALLGGASRETVLDTLRHYHLPVVPVRLIQLALGELFVVGFPAAVAAWVGTDYWRAGSWRPFWRGRGGAIIKGGLAAGCLSVVLGVARYVLVVIPAVSAVVPPPGARVNALAPWWHLAVRSVSTIPGASALTAILSAWRPRPLIGAFAGSGMAAGFQGIFELLGALTEPEPVRAHVFGLIGLTSLAAGMVIGGVAGSFAGAWEEEPTV